MMNRFTYTILSFFLLTCFSVSAQSLRLSGKVVDKADGSAIIQATVQLLAPEDSMMISGNVTNDQGLFALPVNKGHYLLKVSFVGYIPAFLPINVSGARAVTDVGTLQLETDAIMLDEAVIVAQAPEVTAVGDTMVYNSSAYRLPEGSALEALVKKLPGAEVDEDGKITINGKEIKKIMVNGKEFFADNPELALKNLPTSIIDKVLAYDKESDMARMTGIDDGEEETVLDLSLKPGMNKGWFGNADVAGGTEKRYDGKFMVNRFVDNSQITVMGSANNVNDESFPGGGGGHHYKAPNGLNAIKRAGINFATETKKWELGGSVSFDYTDADVQSRSNSQTFISSTVSSFRNASDINRNKAQNVVADFMIEWKPNEKTAFIFRPRFSYNDNHDRSMTQAFTFKKESGYSIDELADAYDNNTLFSLVPEESVVNRVYNHSYNAGNNLRYGGTLLANRTLGNKGRNLSLRLRLNKNEVDREQYKLSETEYFQKEPDSRLKILNRYIYTPTSTDVYAAKVGYVEPLFKNTFIQLSYELMYKKTSTDNNTYDMADDWTIDQGFRPEEGQLNNDLSKYAKYHYINNNTELSFRWINAKNRLNIGVSLQPQKSKFSYNKGDYSVDTVRNVLNFTPTLDYKLMLNKTTTLQINYRGISGQPNILSLLPIVDNTNPLNVKLGNPGLQPSFTNRMTAHFNYFNPTRQRGVMSYLRYQRVQNAISNHSIYNEETGGYTTRPENINGNWNVFGMLGVNVALKNKRFTISNFSTSGFHNMVKFMGSNEHAEGTDEKNITKRFTLSERLRGTYRNDWWECSLIGSLRYSNSRNSFQKEYNMDTYQYTYGASTNVRFSWNMSIATDISQSSRRGYTEASMNTDELIWNAQISQDFLKKNAATISIQVYDILRNQSNISRSISASMRQDSEYNSIFSYCMVHFIYRFDLFGGKKEFEKRGAGRYSGGMYNSGRGRHGYR